MRYVGRLRYKAQLERSGKPSSLLREGVCTLHVLKSSLGPVVSAGLFFAQLRNSDSSVFAFQRAARPALTQENAAHRGPSALVSPGAPGRSLRM